MLCEAYLQQEPTVELFREYFYLNRQNECTNGSSLELGGISIQRRQGAVFPLIVLPSHPKIGTKLGFIVRILLQQTRSLCQVIALAILTPSSPFRISLPSLNVGSFFPPLEESTAY